MRSARAMSGNLVACRAGNVGERLCDGKRICKRSARVLEGRYTSGVAVGGGGVCVGDVVNVNVVATKRVCVCCVQPSECVSPVMVCNVRAISSTTVGMIGFCVCVCVSALL